MPRPFPHSAPPPGGRTRRAFLQALAAGALVGACSRRKPTALSSWAAQGGEYRLQIPPHGAYTGAFIEFGDREDEVTLEKIESFESLVGKHQAIIASSSYWGEQTFPEANVRLIARHGSVPLIYWSPWDRPYLEGRGPDKYSLLRILAGEHDAYIDMWADKAREIGWPIIVSFANEMNGSWFPWSGLHYGAGTEVTGETSEKFQGPETFKAAWRHIVDRVRARRADNVLWALHLMMISDPNEPWNLAKEYYPGADYVDWLGLSVYGSQFPADPEWAPFLPLIEWPFEELSQLDPHKPIMLCEWGAAELPHLGDRAEWISDAFQLMKEPKYARLKAAVFWHERWQNSDGENAGKYSNLRVNSSPAALAAYRTGVADPFYLAEPLLVSVGPIPPAP